jgi:YVTN family beta-propeller protein
MPGATGFVYDSGKDLMFSANQYNDSVSVISNHTVIKTIAVGVQPRAVAYDPVMGKIFVTNSYVNTVSVISDAASTPSQPGTGGQQPNKGTPGFELLIVIGAAAIVLSLKRKR